MTRIDYLFIYIQNKMLDRVPGHIMHLTNKVCRELDPALLSVMFLRQDGILIDLEDLVP